MLCPSVFPPSVPMRPFLDVHWPVRSLWPETRPLFYHMEQEMVRHLQEMRQNMEFMERLHQKIFEEIDAASSSSFQPIAFQELGRDGGSFALSLDTKEFSPEELSVKQVGRRLRVSGRSERKQEDGRGSYSYRCQEFRQEFELPAGVEPEAVSCSLLGGRLQIQAPRDGKERIVPISVSSVPAVTAAAVASASEGGSAAPSEGAPSEAS